MAQKSEDRALSDVDLLFNQLGSYLRQRNIRLLRHQAPDKFFIRRQTIGLYPPNFAGRMLPVLRGTEQPNSGSRDGDRQSPQASRPLQCH
jgi:hypothetical protein